MQSDCIVRIVTILGNSTGTGRLLILVFAPLFLISLGVISHNAFAMGSPPGTCTNEYDGPIVFAQISLRNQTFDPISDPGATIELVAGGGYNLTYTVHTPSQNAKANTDPGQVWVHTDVNGFGQGICEGSVGPNQNMTASGIYGGHMSAVSWNTLVSGFSYNVNWAQAGSQDFTPAAWPGHFRLAAGSSADSTISVTSVDTFNGTVFLSSSSQSGITTSLDSSSLEVSPGKFASTTLHISASPTASGPYAITVTATNGTQTRSATIALTVFPYVPSAPQKIAAYPGNSQAFLSWSPPSDNGTRAITNYDIYRSTAPGGEAFLAQTGNVLGYTDNTVTNGQTYYYTVRAENSVGQGAASLEDIVTPTQAGPLKITTVPVGKNPQGIGANPGTNKIYVANYLGGTVSVIDGATDSVSSTITVGTYPNEIGVNPNTNKIYVTQLGNDAVSVIDGATDTVTGTIPVGHNPYGIGVNPVTNKIYVTNISGGLSVIDGATNSVITTVPMPIGQLVAVNPNTNKIYVTAGNNAVNIVDGANDTVIGTVPLGYMPIGITVNPVTNMVYATENPIWNGANEGIVTIIDGTTNHIINTIPLAGNYEIGANPGTNTIYMASNDATRTLDDVMYVIDGAKSKVIDIIPVGADPYGIGINPDTGNVYVTNGDDNTVSIISSSPSTTSLQPPTGLTAAGTSSSQINLGWNAPAGESAAITGYKIERSDNGGATWSSIVPDTGSTSTAYSDTNLSHSTTYAYRVSATSSSGTSAPSNTASATTFNIAPTPPLGLVASGKTLQIDLSWNAPADDGGATITGYKIERSNDGGSTWSTIQSNSSGTTYSDSQVLPTITYTYQVSAINSVGTSAPSNAASASTTTITSDGIALENVQSISGTVSASNTITIANFTTGTGSNQLLLVGISANNNDAASVTFGGVPLKNTAYSFYNNDAEFWYLKNPSGTGDIIVTTNGPTQAVVGAYSFSGVNQTVPIPTHTVRHNINPNSPTISITAKYPNDLILDLPSMYGGSTLGSPTCAQHWDLNVPDQITGASSSKTVAMPEIVTCSWTANIGDLWDDIAVEINAAR